MWFERSITIKMSNVRSLLLFLSAITGTMAIDLHRENFPMHGNMSVCGHDTVTLNWTYTLRMAESLDQIEWLFESENGTNRTLAKLDNKGNFRAVDPRVTFLGGSGIRIVDLTAEYDGLVKSEIRFTYRGVYHVRVSTVNVTSRIYVSEPPALKSNEMVLKMVPAATKDPTSGKWLYYLQCGSYIYKGYPKVIPVIKTPSGKSLQVMDRDGQSYMAQLNETDPEEGVYTCEQPTNIPCLSKEPSPGNFSLTQRDLRDARLLARLVAIEDATDEAIEEMKNLTAIIGFSAQIQKASRKFDVFDPIVYETVHYNHGHGYNATSGVFTAPVYGDYMVHATGYTYSKNSFKPNYFSIRIWDIVNSIGISSFDDNSNYVSVVASAVLFMFEGDELAVYNSAEDAWWSGGSFSACLLATGFEEDLTNAEPTPSY